MEFNDLSLDMQEAIVGKACVHTYANVLMRVHSTWSKHVKMHLFQMHRARVTRLMQSMFIRFKNDQILCTVCVKYHDSQMRTTYPYAFRYKCSRCKIPNTVPDISTVCSHCENKKCCGITTRGNRCAKKSSVGRLFCQFHDNAYARKRLTHHHL